MLFFRSKTKVLLSTICLWVCGVVVLGGCASISDDLKEASASYKRADYAETRAWMIELDPRVSQMTQEEKADYYFLKGMLFYRLDKYQQALHHLSLSKVIANRLEGKKAFPWVAIADAVLVDISPREKTFVAWAPDTKVDEEQILLAEKSALEQSTAESSANPDSSSDTSKTEATTDAMQNAASTQSASTTSSKEPLKADVEDESQPQSVEMENTKTEDEKQKASSENPFVEADENQSSDKGQNKDEDENNASSSESEDNPFILE